MLCEYAVSEYHIMLTHNSRLHPACIALPYLFRQCLEFHRFRQLLSLFAERMRRHKENSPSSLLFFHSLQFTHTLKLPVSD